MKTTTSRAIAQPQFAAFLMLAALYAVAFIWRTSFVIDGVRYFCLADDPMISMRYAKHLMEGSGLIWNPGGPRVEGFTNGAWVFLMAAFHLLLPAHRVAAGVQLFGAACLLIVIVLIRRLADRLAMPSHAAWIAVALTAFYWPLNYWMLLGFEVSALAVLVTAAVTLAAGEVSERRLACAFACLGAATLIRLDMAVTTVVFAAALLWRRPDNRRQILILAVTSIAIAVSVQTALRVWYYHAWLPNTYYLKLTGTPLWVRWSRGALTAVEFIRGANWILWLAAIGSGLVARDTVRPVAAAVVIGQVAYSAYVGGDAWEEIGANRFIAIAMPLYFVLLADVAGRMLGLAADVVRPRLFTAAAFATTVLLVADSNMSRGPRSMSEWLLVKRPRGVDMSQSSVMLARTLQQMTAPDASVAVVWAGSIPYFSERPSIDLLGKNDTTIAHEPSHQRWTGLGRLGDFTPGHSKWDAAYSIGTLKPDVVAQVWEDDTVAAMRVMGDDYRKTPVKGFGDVYVRRGSPRILWDRLP